MLFVSADELKTRLSAYLRGENVLLSLGNFEHLVDGAPLLSELLQKAPSLKILVTSRERLNLQGEWTFELGGLTVPPSAEEGQAEYSALQRLELRARRLLSAQLRVGEVLPAERVWALACPRAGGAESLGRGQSGADSTGDSGGRRRECCSVGDCADCRYTSIVPNLESNRAVRLVGQPCNVSAQNTAFMFIVSQPLV